MRLLCDIFFETFYDFFPVFCPIEQWMLQSSPTIPRLIEQDTRDIILESIDDVVIPIIDDE